MVAQYNVFGRQVGSHILAMSTFGALGAGIWLSRPSAPQNQSPLIESSSKEEENFIKEFLKTAQEEESKSKDAHAH